MTQKTTTSVKVSMLAIAIFAGIVSQAQDWKSEKRVNILFELAQPVLASGFNIEGNYITTISFLIIPMAHPLILAVNWFPMTWKNRGVAVHEPWTTGFGIGYRLKEWINVRVEPKWHRFEFYSQWFYHCTLYQILANG